MPLRNQMVWDIYGPGLEMVWAKLWPIYVYYVDLTLPYIANPYPVTVLNYCHSIVFSYEIATYLAKICTFTIESCMWMVWVCPISSNPVLWDCYAYLAKIHTLTIESGWEMLPWKYHGILTRFYGIATYLTKFHIISILAGYTGIWYVNAKGSLIQFHINSIGSRNCCIKYGKSMGQYIIIPIAKP